MPFFGKRTKPDDMSRKRLEYQLHLAKHGPDNVVDLSSCELKHVPSGIYALCKVLLKEVLILHSNHLKDLREDDGYEDLSKLQGLRVLDVYNNQLVELPLNIDRLSSLQVLNLQQNRLKSLPDSVCCLKSLQTLNLKDNELQRLPENLGQLCSLRTLDVSHNKIRSLPESLCQARCLETLVIDAEQMVHPSKDVCKAGTAEVMKLLCSEFGIDYLPPSHTVVSLMNKPDATAPLAVSADLIATANSSSVGRTRSLGSVPDSFEQLAARAMTYENVKDQRRKELVRLEGDLLDSNKKQMELLELMTASRRDLLRMVEQEQTDSEVKFHNLQEMRDMERRRFLAYLTNMEEHTKTLIAQLLDMNAKAKKTEGLLEQEERVKQAEEGLFKVKMDEYERLRKEEVKRAMEMSACQYFSLEQLREMQESKRGQIADQARFEEEMTNENLQAVLHCRDRQMRDLMHRLIAEEHFQKELLLALMEQRDSRSNRLNRQIELIQRELTHLSLLELRNKEQRETDIMNRLREQREALCAMMMQLLDEKAHRSKELQKRLVEMEKERLQDQIDFWLIHYQRLLDTKPDALIAAEQDLDIAVIKILNVSHAEEYVPAFARHHVTPESMIDLTEEDLQKMGMYQVGLRKNVLQAIEGYKAEKKLFAPPRSATTVSTPSDPSAPPAPTLLARFEMECVICMSEECGLVFLPCGHVCCCGSCGEKILECPLCRAGISQRIDLRAGTLCK